MTKIVKIKVKNLKAIADEEIILDGESIIVTGANDSGKSTLLCSLIERIKSNIPEKIVRQGESDGFYEMELTDGCKITWRFTENSENITFTTKEGFPVKTKVIETLQKRYFASKKTFDINKFINSSPKEQQKMLCQLLGLDFSEIDSRYKQAFDKRTIANSELKLLIGQKKQKPTFFEKPDEAKLKSKKELLNSIRENWEMENDKLREEVDTFNQLQFDIETNLIKFKNELHDIESVSNNFKQYIDFEGIEKFIAQLPVPKEKKKFEKTPFPKEKTIEIEKSIESFQEDEKKYAVYERELLEYEKWVEIGKKARIEYERLDELVNSIELEKKKIIESANMPEGFEFSDNGLIYNGFELNQNAQSTSAIYIAGLKLATLNIGELECIHFEASALDRKKLNEVQKYANSIGLQLLVERPDFDGGDLKVEIINEL